jgi:predicted metal-dependent enzyme (double-stranded beta helix superfamily)
MAMLKLLYKPLGLLISVAAGIAAGALFNRVWTLATGQRDAPEATDQHRDWREVLVAAGVQGAVFGMVKATLDRGGAAGFRKVTGIWPGK